MLKQLWKDAKQPQKDMLATEDDKWPLRGAKHLQQSYKKHYKGMQNEHTQITRAGKRDIMQPQNQRDVL